MFTKKLLVIGLLALLLSACGTASRSPVDQPGERSFSGTIYAPAGEDVAGTLVYACYFTNDTCDEARSKGETITASGSNASFTIKELEDLTYVLVALKDVDGNGEFMDEGDFYAQIAQVTPPKSGLELRMAVVGDPGTDPGTDPGPGPGGPIPAALQGEWFTGTISSIQFYDPVTGRWADTNGEGFYIIFRADGSYEEGAIINSTQYNCTLRIMGRAVGTFTATADTLTLHQQERRTSAFGNCSGAGEQVLGPETTVYGWRIDKDEGGNQGLFLTYEGRPYATFYPWGRDPNLDPGTDPEPGTFTFSGTVYAPEDGDIWNTVVKACYKVDGACDFEKSKFDGMLEHGASSAFTIEGLEALPYTIMAFKDVDGDGDFFGMGDYYVELPGTLIPTQTGLELRLEVIGTTDPEPEELVLSGTVHAPVGEDVVGAVVVACFLDGDSCNWDKSPMFNVTGFGESAPFEIPGLEAASYYLFAFTDIDLDGEFGSGDFFGELGVVTPPALNLSIQLEVSGN